MHTFLTMMIGKITSVFYLHNEQITICPKWLHHISQTKWELTSKISKCWSGFSKIHGILLLSFTLHLLLWHGPARRSSRKKKNFALIERTYINYMSAFLYVLKMDLGLSLYGRQIYLVKNYILLYQKMFHLSVCVPSIKH